MDSIKDLWNKSSSAMSTLTVFSLCRKSMMHFFVLQQTNHNSIVRKLLEVSVVLIFSVIIRIDNKRHRTHPWGDPVDDNCFLDRAPLALTDWGLQVKKANIHFTTQISRLIKIKNEQKFVG